MAVQRELPDSLGEQGRRLVVELRRLKERGGLSLTALAGRTSCSRSSWDRYLNGQALPPASVVRELARLCGEDPDRLLALRSLAESDRSGRESEVKGPGDATGAAGDGGTSAPSGAPSPAAVTDEPAAPARRRRRPRVVTRLALATVTAAALGLTAFLLMGSTEPATGDSRQVNRTPFVYEPGSSHTCDVHREAGLLYAGHSNTVDVLLQQISTSWEVVEAQCLLRYRGYAPGEIDGAYGLATEKAVKRLQDEAGLVPDGIVGPHTWEVLRR
jgi:transcriptional regulator with XRE-family HTH domain